MSPASRATSTAAAPGGVASRARARVALYQGVGATGTRGSKLGRAGEISLTTPGLDLAATLPDVAVSAEDLLQAADKAMYRVKDAGKNGIQAATAPADN